MIIFISSIAEARFNISLSPYVFYSQGDQMSLTPLGVLCKNVFVFLFKYY